MKVAVIGTGTMGNGIAQTFAQAGHDVLLKGRSEASLQRAHKAIDKSLSKMVEKGKMEAAQKDAIIAKIVDTMDYNDCADADLVVELLQRIWQSKRRSSRHWTRFANQRLFLQQTPLPSPSQRLQLALHARRM